jgi:hypothetical protein
MREHPFMPLLKWVVPDPSCSPCLSRREEWPTTLVFGYLGEPNTRLFRDSILGNMPTRVEAFPDAILEMRRHAPQSPLDWVAVPSRLKIAVHLVNTLVFLPREAIYPGTCKHSSVFKVLQNSSYRGAKKWKCFRQGLGPNTPSHVGSSTLACGGLKPKPLSSKYQAS